MTQHRINVADLFKESAFERYPEWREWWVDIRPHQGHATVQRLEAARQPSMSMKAGEFDRMVEARDQAKTGREAVAAASDAAVEIPFGGDPGQYTAILIAESVVGWNLRKPDGTALLVSEQGEAHPDLMDAIVDAIADYYQGQRLSAADLKGTAPA